MIGRLARPISVIFAFFRAHLHTEKNKPALPVSFVWKHWMRSEWRHLISKSFSNTSFSAADCLVRPSLTYAVVQNHWQYKGSHMRGQAMFKRQGELRIKKKKKHNYSEEQAESNIRNTFKNCSRVSLSVVESRLLCWLWWVAAVDTGDRNQAVKVGVAASQWNGKWKTTGRMQLGCRLECVWVWHASFAVSAWIP